MLCMGWAVWPPLSFQNNFNSIIATCVYTCKDYTLPTVDIAMYIECVIDSEMSILHPAMTTLFSQSAVHIGYAYIMHHSMKEILAIESGFG